MNNRALKTFLGYHWYAFVSIFLVVSVFYYYVFDMMTTPTYEESIRLFVASEVVDAPSLENKLFQGFDSEHIKEVKVDYSSPNSPYFSSVFQTRGLVQTDLLILPLSVVPSGDYFRYFVQLDETIINDYLSEETQNYYKDEDTYTYGIQCIGDALEYITTGEEDYYVFFNKNSDKLGLLSSQSDNNAALLALVNLFEKDTV